VIGHDERAQLDVPRRTPESSTQSSSRRHVARSNHGA
jgi:hypothetical protein